MRLYLVCFALSLSLPAFGEGHFGMIGITPFETARLSAFCDGSVVPTPCDVTFEFHDANGGMLKQVSMTIQPESVGYADFALPPAILAAGRVEIAPCWDVLRGTAQGTLELMDNFLQRTRLLVVYGPGAMPRSSADVDFGGIGITRYDTARMSALCTADSTDAVACDVTFEFHDAGGRTIKASRMTIPAGGSGHVDLTFAEAATAGGRVTILPCWTVATGGAVLSLQTFDNFTGLTLTQGYPAIPAASIAP